MTPSSSEHETKEHYFPDIGQDEPFGAIVKKLSVYAKLSNY